MLVASSWSIRSSLRLGLPVLLSLFLPSRWRLSRSRRLISLALRSSSVRGLSAPKTEDSELRRGRRSEGPRFCGESSRSLPAFDPDRSCMRRALNASSCDRVGRCDGGGPRPSRGGTFSRRDDPPGGPLGGPRAPPGLGTGLAAGAESSSMMIKLSWN